jgi:hypothetical protein
VKVGKCGGGNGGIIYIIKVEGKGTGEAGIVKGGKVIR